MLYDFITTYSDVILTGHRRADCATGAGVSARKSERVQLFVINSGNAPIRGSRDD